MFLTLLVVTFELLGIVSAVHAVMSVRTPQGTIAWAVSLVAMPFLAVPAYWVFGRNKFKGYVLARQRTLAELDHLVREANQAVETGDAADDGRRGPVSFLEKLGRIPVTIGNRVRLLVDGEQTFADLFEGLKAARDYALVQFYIVHDDDLGRELQAHMIDCAARGVKVRFLYDEIGSFGLPGSYLEALRQAGVEVTSFHSRKGAGNRFQLNFRNHRKTVVVDGQAAWIGGHNVGDEYLGRDPDIGQWRDTHVRIDGPAVLGAQLAFAEDWRWATDRALDDLRWDATTYDDGCGAIVVASGPADEQETAALLFTQAINSARHRIWIASPYFVPDEGTLRALQLASMRGVDVRVLIPEKSDNVLVTLAAYSYFHDVKSAGGNIYRYQDGFLHGKFALVNDDVSAIGTANFDNRSFRLNFEITAVIAGEEFAARTKAMFEADFARSRRMERDEVARKPTVFRLGCRLSRLAAPVL